jgi:hypothetical protein
LKVGIGNARRYTGTNLDDDLVLAAGGKLTVRVAATRVRRRAFRAECR